VVERAKSTEVHCQPGDAEERHDAGLLDCAGMGERLADS
jgi:hypothetical protein